MDIKIFILLIAYMLLLAYIIKVVSKNMDKDEDDKKKEDKND